MHFVVEDGEALDGYNNAIESKYSDLKTRKALSVKLAELKMMFTDVDYVKQVDAVHEFLIHSSINDVSVHQAYAHTLLAKFKIINPENYKEKEGLHIKDPFEENLELARSIYQDYGNNYGVFRIDFIEKLNNLYLSTSFVDENSIINDLEILINNNPSYSRERIIFNDVKILHENKALVKGKILRSLMDYPIIMQ